MYTFHCMIMYIIMFIQFHIMSARILLPTMCHVSGMDRPPNPHNCAACRHRSFCPSVTPSRCEWVVWIHLHFLPELGQLWKRSNTPHVHYLLSINTDHTEPKHAEPRPGERWAAFSVIPKSGHLLDCIKAELRPWRRDTPACALMVSALRPSALAPQVPLPGFRLLACGVGTRTRGHRLVPPGGVGCPLFRYRGTLRTAYTARQPRAAPDRLPADSCGSPTTLETPKRVNHPPSSEPWHIPWVAMA